MRARYTLVGITIIGAMTAAIIGYAMFLRSAMDITGGCSNEVVFAASSKNHRAYVFIRNCGATVGYFTNVSIVDEPDGELPNESGNVFRVDGYFEDMRVEWETQSRLTVTGFANDADEFYKVVVFENGIEIIYRPDPAQQGHENLID